MKLNIYKENYKKFLKKLIEARHQAGLRQIDVVQKIGKPQPYLSKIETGERRLDIIELQELATLYDKPLSFFTADRN
jgi:transcriptional regulator with XRE-family HTH domain